MPYRATYKLTKSIHVLSEGEDLRQYQIDGKLLRIQASGEISLNTHLLASEEVSHSEREREREREREITIARPRSVPRPRKNKPEAELCIG